MTKQEQGIVLFLIFSLLIGSVVTLYDRFFAEEILPEVNPQLVGKFLNRSDEIAASSDSLEIRGTLQGTFQLGANDNSKAKPSEAQSSESKFLIDINTANQVELQRIPRIGPVLAKRIIDYRKINGKFKDLGELRRVKGIGEATLGKMLPYVSIKEGASEKTNKP